MKYTTMTRLFSSILNRRTGRERLQPALEFQKLEDRNLLAGDVSVFVDNLQLFVVGDGEANQIQVIGTLNGSARVAGLNGTTINGSTETFVAAFPGLRNGFINMNGGNDEVTVQGARFNFGLSLNGGAGDDTMVARHSSVGLFEIRGGSGNDNVTVDNVFAIRSSQIDMQSGNDMLAIIAHASGEHIMIRTGDGNDTLAVDNMGMHGRLQIDTGSGNDQVLLSGETWIGRDSMLHLGTGNDFLGVMPGNNGGRSQLQKFTRVDGGGGNDMVAFDANAIFGEGSRVDGNQGTDQIDNRGVGLSPGSIQRFENSPFNVNSAMDEVYTAVANAGLDPTLFGAPASFTLGITTSTSALNYTENGAPTSIDSALLLNGKAATQVTSAKVTLTGFQASEDVLAFADTSNITGAFDNTTGVLTLTGNGTLAEYQQALRSVTYSNSSETPSEGQRSFDIELTTTESSVQANRELKVLGIADVPELTVRQTPLDFDIDDTNLARPVVLDNQIQLTDADTAEFEEATIRIRTGFQTGDVLAFTDADGITGSYDANTGVLTLSGKSSTENYQKALRSITFNNSADRAPLGTRTVRIQISDGTTPVNEEFDVTVRASNTIEVNAATDTLTFTESDDLTVIDSTVDIVAAGGKDDALVAGATVRILSGFGAGQDILSYTPVSGISGSFDSTAGVLTFTGSASAGDYETLLRSVTFGNNSDGNTLKTGERQIEFAVEREGLTASASRTMNVIEATDEQLIQKYLTANNLTSIKTASGLHYIVQKEGNGTFPDANSRVKVNYRGTFLDGQEFDSGTDVTFSLQGVIAGWTEGIPKFSVGGSGLLVVPSNLAYGEAGRSNIPPNSNLVFEVDLLSIE